MKNSGIEWIGEIPETWSVSMFKYLIAQNDGGVWGDDPTGEQDRIVLRSTEQTVDGRWSIDEPAKRDLRKVANLEYFICKKDDLLLTKSSGSDLHIGKTTIVDEEVERLDCFYSNFIQRIRVKDEHSARFFWYILNSIIARQQFVYLQNTTSGIGNINATYINQLIVPNIKKEEQIEIANYLDQQCAHIDAVIEKTKASIEEYKKLKQAVITQAVTKGIRGDRPMKDSGIEWIGEIPADWEVGIIKYYLRWKSVKGEPDATVLSLYRDYGIIPKDSRDDNHNVTSLDTSTYKVVDEGDFVINKMKAWQGSMGVSHYHGIISPAYHVCEFTSNKIYKKYFHHLMRNHLYLPEYERLSTGMRIGQWDLGFDDFKNIPFVIPSQEEQQDIVEYIEEKSLYMDKLIEKKTEFLNELENYKKSLIYEYVTGKKEVPCLCQ
ncbi:MAG: restriction endonuclease subunit S [Candidatus Bruticola sp.]